MQSWSSEKIPGIVRWTLLVGELPVSCISAVTPDFDWPEHTSASVAPYLIQRALGHPMNPVYVELERYQDPPSARPEWTLATNVLVSFHLGHFLQRCQLILYYLCSSFAKKWAKVVNNSGTTWSFLSKWFLIIFSKRLKRKEKKFLQPRSMCTLAVHVCCARWLCTFAVLEQYKQNRLIRFELFSSHILLGSRGQGKRFITVSQLILNIYQAVILPVHKMTYFYIQKMIYFYILSALNRLHVWIRHFLFACGRCTSKTLSSLSSY